MQLEKNKTVELVIVDEGWDFDLTHPIHIHGYSPYIVAMERRAKQPNDYFGRPAAGGGKIS